ncbi:MAG: hypothetical protein J6T47_10685, partial [Lachnospiraceae bacterium]|nr:hypothetical protein [Lachnospiraceae bacterium]
MAENRDDRNNNTNSGAGSDPAQRNGEQPYIREKIVKPKRRSRFLAMVIGGFFGAVMFGLIACVSFVWIYPYVSKMRGPEVEETTTAERITLPTHSEEETTQEVTTTAPTETSLEETSPEETQESESESEGLLQPGDREWIERLIDRKIDEDQVSIRDLELYSREIIKVYQGVEKSLVTIQAKASVDPVFPSNQGAISGIMFSHLDSVRTIVILTNYEAAKLKDPVVRFAGQTEYRPAQVRGTDSIMGLAVLSVAFDEKDEEFYKSLPCIELGNTYQIRSGSPVIAVGAPFGSCGTMSYGS